MVKLMLGAVGDLRSGARPILSSGTTGNFRSVKKGAMILCIRVRLKSDAVGMWILGSACVLISVILGALISGKLDSRFIAIWIFGT